MSSKMHIIDVREPHEFSAGHAEGARNMPLSKLAQISQEHADIGIDDKIVVYCRSGGRASIACQILHSIGYSQVINGVNQSTVETEHLLESEKPV